jgi:UDP-GlcNAc3NAcA epimerase
MEHEAPDWVLVSGDTNFTLAGALAAVKLHVPLAHLEAGLRLFNRAMPEEINRVLTDQASDQLFTPTDAATRNLAAEGIPAERVEQVGDVMYDATLFYRDRAEKRSDVLARFDLDRGQHISSLPSTARKTPTTPDVLRPSSAAWPRQRRTERSCCRCIR